MKLSLEASIMKNIFTVVFTFFLLPSFAQNPMLIPDTLSGPDFSLTMHKDSVQFFPGRISNTFAFNSNSYLGPTLILTKGQNVSINVQNEINDTTTVHWHGIHLPSKWDGGPHTVILPNSVWNPQFTVKDNAATYWYHPHLHKRTAEQAIKGAIGLIIVRDSVEAALNLPRKYGIDDFPIIVQSIQFDSLNQAMPKGMQDSTLLVNGTMNPFLNVPAQVVRMRLLNASGERTFNFGFSGNKQFYLIASDGGLLESPSLSTRIRLSPGERAEILINLSGMAGQSFSLMCYGSELAMGIQGGPTMPMPPGSPPMNSPLNGVDYNIMLINVLSPTSNPVMIVPITLTTNYPYLESQASITRTIRFTADSAMVMDGPFYFNDSSFNMERIDYQIPLNNVEIWKLVNETMVAHPFHIHDVQFYILDRNGIPPDVQERGRKDVVLLPPGDSIRFITKFTDFSDTIIPFMFHCHILMHEDDGMMGQFIVKDMGSAGVKELSELNNVMSIYPNPVSGELHVLNVKIADNQMFKFQIINAIGKIVQYSDAYFDSNIDVTKLPAGLYILSIELKGMPSFVKFIKN